MQVRIVSPRPQPSLRYCVPKSMPIRTAPRAARRRARPWRGRAGGRAPGPRAGASAGAHRDRPCGRGSTQISPSATSTGNARTSSAHGSKVPPVSRSNRAWCQWQVRMPSRHGAAVEREAHVRAAVVDGAHVLAVQEERDRVAARVRDQAPGLPQLVHARRADEPLALRYLTGHHNLPVRRSGTAANGRTRAGSPHRPLDGTETPQLVLPIPGRRCARGPRTGPPACGRRDGAWPGCCSRGS